MALIVLFAILFPSVHSYEHISDSGFDKQKTETHNSLTKSEFKINGHSTEKCSICDFKFSTFATTSFTPFQFLKKNVVIHYSFFYSKTLSTFFTGSLFLLRAPPVDLK